MIRRRLYWINRPLLLPAITAVLLALASLPIAVTFVITTPPAAVITGTLNVREGPSVGYAVVTTLEQGADVELVGRNADSSWVQVRLPDGLIAWVSTQFISTPYPLVDLPVTGAVEPLAMVKSGRLNVRSGPGTDYPILFSLTQNEPLAMLGRSPDGDWLKVRVRAQEGWVNAGFVTLSVPLVELPLIPPPPTPAPESAAVYGVGIVNVPEAALYAIPDVTSQPILLLPSGVSFSLLARDATGGWIRVMLEDGQAGWINAANIGSSIPLADLPILTGS